MEGHRTAIHLGFQLHHRFIFIPNNGEPALRGEIALRFRKPQVSGSSPEAGSKQFRRDRSV
jgi:hypothetical protein